MLLTLLLALIFIAAVFGALYAIVGLIQNRKLMTTALEDIINYGSLPYTDFIRTKTLCRGGDLCDFRFVRHETDAGDGWERTESV